VPATDPSKRQVSLPASGKSQTFGPSCVDVGEASARLSTPLRKRDERAVTIALSNN
jgi:hypothetical protein